MKTYPFDCDWDEIQPGDTVYLDTELQGHEVVVFCHPKQYELACEQFSAGALVRTLIDGPMRGADVFVAPCPDCPAGTFLCVIEDEVAIVFRDNDAFIPRLRITRDESVAQAVQNWSIPQRATVGDRIDLPPDIEQAVAKQTDKTISVAVLVGHDIMAAAPHFPPLNWLATRATSGTVPFIGHHNVPHGTAYVVTVNDCRCIAVVDLRGFMQLQEQLNREADDDE